MKALSDKQIASCENATTPVCKCRCGGALHGVARGGPNPAWDFFYDLPEDDPHHIYTRQEKRDRHNAKLREKTRLKEEKRMAMYRKLYQVKP
jgi:hypothetical protein